MKHPTRIALALLLAACGSDNAAETAANDTGATPVNALRSTAGGVRLVEERAPVPIATDAPVLTISTDSGGDGTIERVQQWTYDGRGNRVLMEEDRDGDGVFDEVTRNTPIYDADDRLIRIESDEGADGTIDAIETRTYARGNRVAQIAHDTDADGSVDRLETNVWDDAGRRIQWLQDGPVGGPVEMVQDFWFGEDGRASGRRLTQALGASGPVVTAYRNVFADDGKLWAYEVDKGEDGAVDNRSVRIYDSSGRLAEIQIDIDADGVPDNTSIYTYDAEGRLVQLSTDIGMDGVSETVIYREYHNFAAAQDCLTR